MFYHSMEIVAILTRGWMNMLWVSGAGVYWSCRGRWRDAAVLVAGTALGSAMIAPLKIFFARPRPPLSLVSDSFSFPSGHVLSMTVLAGLFAWLQSRQHPAHRRIYFAGAISIAGLIGFNRVYLHAHYFTDVLGGYFFGLVFVAAWVWVTGKRPSSSTAPTIK